jgi:hypothetical protein
MLNSDCLDRVLLPQESCLLTVSFQPIQGGFYASRMLLQRQGMSPLWIDLQGFAFESIADRYFGDQGVFAFTGGEVLAGLSEAGGVTGGGYMQWSGMPALETAETYIGTEEGQELTLFFDFEPLSSGDQLPTIDIRKLSAFGHETPIELNKTQGWQRQSVYLAAKDFLYIRIQAPGRGMAGILKFDVVAESDILNVSLNEEDADLPIANQAEAVPHQVMLESGGSLSILSLILLIILPLRIQNRRLAAS